MVENSFIREIRKNWALFALLLPAFVIVLVNNYIPMLGSFIAFKDIRYTKPGFIQNMIASPWVGFKNFEFLFNSNSAFIITRNTILYNVLFMVLGTVLAVLLAILLNEVTGKRKAKVYQNITFIPYFISYVAVAYLVYAFLSFNYGLVNQGLLKALGIAEIDWYSSKEYWPLILTIVVMWKWTGYNAVVYLAGISGINSEYFEAAQIDGASKMKQIRYITLPSLAPFIIIMNLLALGRIFYSDFGLFFQTTMNIGALYDTTLVIDTYVYNSLAITGELGMASAAGFYQAIVGLALVLMSNFVVKKLDRDSALF
ncbi:ABC transporter permease [Cohnella terricola]|uniref:Sugar ABC transporter permease n=1 Tax=Cohnella terricola TaxID=1289167 RepID=A0A559J7T8_9BACL|nr:ABC transporter permease subunit [Cohnella terricola]TVX95934.1 sugar ABC transporter permease [Cohnella terricola]